MGSRSMLAAVVLLAGSSSAGCGDFTDPPPDPSEAPLEVVANDASTSRCGLNRSEVAAGVHEVVVVTEGSDAVVELRDASGQVLLTQSGDTFPQSASEDELVATAAPGLPLGEGRYTVVCRYPNGVEGTTSLTVTP